MVTHMLRHGFLIWNDLLLFRFFELHQKSQPGKGILMMTLLLIIALYCKTRYCYTVRIYITNLVTLQLHPHER